MESPALVASETSSETLPPRTEPGDDDPLQDLRAAGEAVRAALAPDAVGSQRPSSTPSAEAEVVQRPAVGARPTARNLRAVIPEPRAAQFIYDRLSAMPYCLDDAIASPQGVLAWLEMPTNRFMWVLDEAGDPVGLIGATGILPERYCDVCIFFWSRQHRRRSFTLPVAYIGLAFLLHETGVERIVGMTARQNRPARRFFSALGFTQEGTAYRAMRYGGELTDGIVYSIMKEELITSIHHFSE